MTWNIEFCENFEIEFAKLAQSVQLEILSYAGLLEEFGPSLGRPHVDTLNGSKYSNMKELRFKCDGGVWRIAFIFDPLRKGILLVAGNKAGKNQKQFYKQLISKAEKRYRNYLNELEV